MHISPEDFTLIGVFILTYLASMYTQYDDPDFDLKKGDFITTFLWSFIGGFLAYKFFSYTTENPGEVLVYTIVISIASPRAFKFLANINNQDRFFNSMFDRWTNSKNKDNDSI